MGLRGLGVLLMLVGVSPAVGQSDSERAEQGRAELTQCARQVAQGLTSGPWSWNSCDCLYRIGTAYGLAEEAARELESLRVSHDDPCLSFNLARLHMLQGDPAAEPLMASAAAGFAQRKSMPGEVYARINLSRVLGRHGQDERARAELDLARQVARSAGDGVLEIQVDLQQARVDLAHGRQLEKVEQQFLSLTERAGALGKDAAPSLLREIWLGLGNVRYQLGWYGEAEAAYRRTAEICQDAEDPYGRATALQNAVIAVVAQSASRQVEKDHIEKLLRNALGAAIAADQPFAQADAGLRLGRLVGGEEGKALVQRSLELGEQLKFRSVQTRALAALALWALESSTDEAKRRVEHSRSVALASPYFGDGVDGWADRLEVEWQLLERQPLMQGMSATLDRIEQWRDQQSQDFGRAQVFAPWTEVYYALSGRLLRASRAASDPLDLERAFGVLERMRARVLLESLTASGVEAENALGADRTVSLGELRATLADGQALLSFQVAPESDVYGRFTGGAWLVVVSQEDVRLYPIPDRRRLAVQARAFLRLFPRRDGSHLKAAQRLYGDLVATAIEELPPSVDQLLIVPDGPLHRLPFAALADSGGRPLVERFQLSVVPSATLWHWWQGSRDPDSKASVSALVLADPQLATGSELPALPSARQEGRSVLRSTSPRSGLWVGAEAGRDLLVRGDLAPFGVIHLAAHAVIDDRRPERSAVILSSANGVDGRLKPSDIAALPLRRKLVVLSACQSAGGAVFAGEGTLSLARTFFKAGASAVVGSLWPVRDGDSAELFDHFYRHLARGETAAQALASTQQELVALGRPAEQWAGWVVLGDGSLSFAPLGTVEGMWAKLKLAPVPVETALTAALLLVFAAMLWRRP